MVKHFQEALRGARPSVSRHDLVRYEVFKAQLVTSRGSLSTDIPLPESPAAAPPGPSQDDHELYAQ